MNKKKKKNIGDEVKMGCENVKLFLRRPETYIPQKNLTGTVARETAEGKNLKECDHYRKVKKADDY